MDISHFVHLSVDRLLGCFQFCGITNEAVVNVHVRVFVWTRAFISLE